jgi:tryptophan halogenase
VPAADRIPRIAIIGGGLSAWMAAAAFANAFRRRAGAITLVDISPSQSVQADEASLPTIRAFNAKLGISEDQFIRRAKAIFSLGTEFKGWTGPGTSFIHGFGRIGTGVGDVGFHHCWFRLRECGDAGKLEDYSLAAVAASLGRFRRPADDAGSVLSSYSYAFRFDGERYCELLREISLANGVERTEAKSIDVRLNGEDGSIAAVGMDGGTAIEADLYLDCTGAEGLLIERALHAGFERWSAWLPCDRLLSVRSEADGDESLLTRVAAHPGGWRLQVSARERETTAFVYSSAFTTDAEAEAEFASHVPPSAAHRAQISEFRNGRRKKFWVKNCVALGGAAGFLEPLESTRVHLLQSEISRLLALVPAGAAMQACAEEYNRLMTAEYDQVRDFLILHYCANGVGASPLWDHCRAMPLPDSLAYAIDLFKSRGRVTADTGDVFFLPSWLSLFVGLGVLPRRHHPFADGLSAERLAQQLGLMRSTIRQAAQSMPTHGAFLAQIAQHRT